MANENTIIIGIAGSSGSGKTTLAQALYNYFQTQLEVSCELISADNYYRDLGHLTADERHKVNFDHPDSIEFTLLKDGLNQLKMGSDSIQVPSYDFVTHLRTAMYTIVPKARVILVEGILLFTPEADLTDTFDASIFVDSPPEVCFQRRLERDIRERGRTKDSITAQYEQTVRPMDEQFVRPSKEHASLVAKNKSVQTSSETSVEFNLRPLLKHLTPLLSPEQLSQVSRKSIFSRGPTVVDLVVENDATVNAEKNYCHCAIM